jgi:galactonate dehydratase
VEQGFTAVKFDPAGPYTIYDPHQPLLTDIERSAAMVKAVREAVGTRADILFGTHGQFTPSGAARMAKGDRALRSAVVRGAGAAGHAGGDGGVREEDVDPGGDRRAADDEVRVRAVLALGAAQIVQPDLGRSGGIWEGKKIAAHRGSASRAGRAALLLRAGGGGGEHPACRLDAELPDPRGDQGLGRLPCRAC